MKYHIAGLSGIGIRTLCGKAISEFKVNEVGPFELKNGFWYSWTNRRIDRTMLCKLCRVKQRFTREGFATLSAALAIENLAEQLERETQARRAKRSDVKTMTPGMMTALKSVKRADAKKKRVKRKRREPTENLEHAQKMLAEWETTQARAMTCVKKWRKRVAYYTNRVEKENVQLRLQLAEQKKPKRRIVLEGNV